MSEDQKNSTPVVTVEPTNTETPKVESNVSQESKNYALIAHLGGIFTFFVAPLIIYLVKTDDKFVQEEAKEALNFQLMISIALLACNILFFLILPLLLIPIIWIISLIFGIIASISVSDGKPYKYPINFRLIK